jgi:hypothetical protein
MEIDSMGVMAEKGARRRNFHVLWTDHCESYGNTRTRRSCYNLMVGVVSIIIVMVPKES